LRAGVVLSGVNGAARWGFGARRGDGWSAGGSGAERVDRLQRRVEDVAVWIAGCRAEDHSPAGAHDPRGDAEEEVAKRLGGAAQWRVLRGFAGGASRWAQVAAEGGEVERGERCDQPNAVGVL